MGVVEFTQSTTFEMPDSGMYGIESVLLKKHVWLPGQTEVRGSLLHDPETGRQYFVTDDDLGRYRVKAEPPVL